MRTKLLLTVLAAAAVLTIPALALAAGAEPCAAGEWQEYQAKGWLWMYLAAFGFGFLTSLTPCVYPMIPIVVGVFGARDESVTRIKAFALATFYVLGMGVMYAALGVVFALLGKQFGTILANPWVVIPLVVFYVVLAASMFGAFDLNLPASWQARLNQVGGKGYGGAFGMGLVGGLTAAPCTGPFLAGILGFVATTKNVAGGSTLLFTYAIGMGILFWVIAAFTVSLPKSGQWMEWIKSIGGIALLAVALYFLRPIIPVLEKLTSTSLVFLGSSIALLVIGLALGAVHLSFYDGWPIRIRKGVAVAVTVAGITGVVNWVLTPDRKLPWHHSEDTAFAEARAQGKGVMIDFAANWCNPCKELELTFAADGVFDLLTENFVPVKYDVSKGTEEDEKLQARWRAQTLPAVLFIDAAGNELGRVSKYLPVEEFLQVATPAAHRVQGKLDAPAPCITGTSPAGTAGAPEAPAQKPAQTAEPVPDTPEGKAAMAPAEPAADSTDKPAADSTGEPAADSADSELPWLHDDVEAFLTAEAGGKGVFIDFYASWCAPCTAMKKTFADSRVAEAIVAKYVPVHLDVTHLSDADQAKLEAYEIENLPAMVFFNAGGEERVRITKFMSPSELLETMAALPD